MTEAIGAIAVADPREQAAERQRGRWLLLSLLIVGLGGVALLALLDVAVWLFLGSLAFYAFYLLVLAPALDGFDPPDASNRAQRRNALWSYLAATAVVVIAWWSGRLQPVVEAHAVVLLGAAVLAAGMAVYAVRLDRSSRLGSVGRFAPPTGEAEPGEPDQLDDAVLPATVVMRPSWSSGAFFDEHGRPVDLERFVAFTDADRDGIADWFAIVTEVVDKNDPYRCAMKDPDGVQKLDTAGRPLFERLRERMGEDRIRFDPCPAPVPTQHEARVIKLMVDWPAIRSGSWMTIAAIRSILRRSVCPCNSPGTSATGRWHSRPSRRPAVSTQPGARPITTPTRSVGAFWPCDRAGAAGKRARGRHGLCVSTGDGRGPGARRRSDRGLTGIGGAPSAATLSSTIGVGLLVVAGSRYGRGRRSGQMLLQPDDGIG